MHEDTKSEENQQLLQRDPARRFTAPEAQHGMAFAEGEAKEKDTRMSAFLSADTYSLMMIAFLPWGFWAKKGTSRVRVAAPTAFGLCLLSVCLQFFCLVCLAPSMFILDEKLEPENESKDLSLVDNMKSQLLLQVDILSKETALFSFVKVVGMILLLLSCFNEIGDKARGLVLFWQIPPRGFLWFFPWLVGLAGFFFVQVLVIVVCLPLVVQAEAAQDVMLNCVAAVFVMEVDNLVTRFFFSSNGFEWTDEWEVGRELTDKEVDEVRKKMNRTGRGDVLDSRSFAYGAERAKNFTLLATMLRTVVTAVVGTIAFFPFALALCPEKKLTQEGIETTLLLTAVFALPFLGQVILLLANTVDWQEIFADNQKYHYGFWAFINFYMIVWGLSCFLALALIITHLRDPSSSFTLISFHGAFYSIVIPLMTPLKMVVIPSIVSLLKDVTRMKFYGKFAWFFSLSGIRTDTVTAQEMERGNLQINKDVDVVKLWLFGTLTGEERLREIQIFSLSPKAAIDAFQMLPKDLDNLLIGTCDFTPPVWAALAEVLPGLRSLTQLWLEACDIENESALVLFASLPRSLRILKAGYNKFEQSAWEVVEEKVKKGELPALSEVSTDAPQSLQDAIGQNV
uniref:Uncharacterized protein n=1 Tax=Chromera velia CCMP2878 TaxID=1169474 RepID=A0A0G4F175_9ALVE|eukprot:Cvel_14676.t1-p1 / transcript=Cvel_14676.t1 / gene=Cvel_14676 / organism=Chromera_velia_CCMP2878 / gene_product=hypothetical protein / transcript_product=hypothetical protein / location=Cvel_scaffold1052:36658-38529(+) / protein_length=624 / sequence_SO=supercontig / SO=protein_coding / is_pseudo=false